MESRESPQLAIRLLPLLLGAGCSLSPVSGAELTVSISGVGDGVVGVIGSDAILCPDNCTEFYPAGTEVTLVATPFAGFQVESWSDNCQRVRTSSNTAIGRTCKITLEENETVEVTFGLKSKTLEVEIEGEDHGRVFAEGGVISCRANSAATNKCEATLNYGRRIHLFADADPGYRLEEWTGDCLGQASCGITLTKDRKVSVRFVEDLVTIKASQTGDGSGRIVSNPVAIDCGSNCETTVLRGQTLSLSASPESGSVFTGWSGACSGTGSCLLQATNSINEVTANFDIEYFTLTASVTGLGEIFSLPEGILCGQGNSQCSLSLAAGTEIVLDTNTDIGQEFIEWSGACAGTGSCPITMTENLSVGAFFSPAIYTLSVNIVGAGQGTITSTPAGINCPSDCDGSFSHGTMVTLSPTPSAGSRFSGWTGVCAGQEQCSILMDDFSSVIASFEVERHEINVVHLGLGNGQVTSTPLGISCPGDCDTILDHGQSITLSAEAEPGSKFVGWKGACHGTEDCTISVRAAGSIGAKFENEFSLIIVQEFTQGSTLTDLGTQANEQPPVPVRLTGNFLMKTTEVTHGEWKKLMGDSPSSFPGCGNNCPIETVNYEQAAHFLNRLSDYEGFPRCYTGSGASLQFVGVHCLGYRLPTASEWEYAARAGSNLSFAGVDITNTDGVCGPDTGLNDLGWYCSNSNFSIQPVARKTPNALGLYDMHGNVSEWTQSRYDPNYYQALGSTNVDPQGSNASSLYEIRGGSWNDLPISCRSAAREGIDPAVGQNSVGFRPVRRAFAKIPAGEFKMGSPIGELGQLINETPQHEVLLTKPFWINRTEVTQAEYEALTNSNPSFFSGCGAQCPVDSVSFDQSINYVNQLSTQAGLTPCYTAQGATWNYLGSNCSGYRLLFESEWERAARGDSLTAFFGADINSIGCADVGLNPLGWYCANSSGTPHPVAQKPANKFGLYDAHGNVQEFVYDYYSSNYYSSTPRVDPTGPSNGTERTVRGGHFNSSAAQCRSSSRSSQIPNLLNSNTGIRIGRSACVVPDAQATNVTGAPAGRSNAEVVWTGHEVIILGGERVGVTLDYSAFDPFENTWRPLSTMNAPQLARSSHGVEWAESDVMIWGGLVNGNAVTDGATYNPNTDTWRRMANSLSMPSARSHFSKTWTGVEWFIWGGKNGQVSFNDGARYLPSSDKWTPINRSTLSSRFDAAAVWTSTTVLVLGGTDDANNALSDYAFYDPSTNQWSNTFTMPTCSGKTEATVVNGHVLVASESGWCSYNLSSGVWQTVPARPSQRALFPPSDGVFVSNGKELLVYGGTILASDGVLDAYDPLSNTWRTPASTVSGESRFKTQGLWIGCRVFMWSDVSNVQSGIMLGL